MSVAVCLKCGAQKWGALTLCSECRHRPVDAEDQARHLLAVQDVPPPGVLALGAHIAAGGQPAEPDPAELEETLALLARATPARVALWGLAVGCAPVVVIAAGLLLLAWLAEAL